MRSPSRKLLFLLVAALAAVVPATIAIGAVVGERGTRIISPPGGAPSSSGQSDKTDYATDGARARSRTPTTDPIVDTPRPADNIEFSQDNRVVKYAAYSSQAPNIVAGAPGDGHRHIYLFERQPTSGDL